MTDLDLKKHSAEAGCKILVVDDDPMILDILRCFISAFGYEQVAVSNGLEAVEELQKDAYDVVITDLNMPVMDGIALLRYVKRHYPRTDVIVITGQSETTMYTAIINEGGSDFLSKPFEGDELEAKLNRLLREQKLIREFEWEIMERRQAERRLLEAKRQIEAANAAKDQMIKDLFSTMEEMLANRDHYTFEHALRVAEISKRIGLRLGLRGQEIETLDRACLVHDIGKIVIPDDVLLKPGRFDSQDKQIMQIHPEVGANLFSKRHQDEQIAYIIRHHHERLDGSGYPSGLKGEELNLLVRIVSVADVYEALVAKRVYKDSMSSAKAFDLLWLDVAEGRLDGKVVVALSQVLEDWDPLSITRDFAADYMLDLELFRRMSYFKEPLTEFYNYRYLYFLDDAKLLGKNSKPYHLIATNFAKLGKFNQANGHAKVDQILEDVGHRLQEVVDNFIDHAKQVEGTVRLFRKGADYLVYSDYPPKQAVILREQVEENLRLVELDWELETRMVNQQFAIGYPVEKALDELFSKAIHE